MVTGYIVERAAIQATHERCDLDRLGKYLGVSRFFRMFS